MKQGGFKKVSDAVRNSDLFKTRIQNVLTCKTTMHRLKSMFLLPTGTAVD